MPLVNVPGAFAPGELVAPEFTATVPTVPLPDNVAADAMVTALFDTLPLTCKLPMLMVVAPL